jgi:Uma2 family endonuclease
MAIPKPKPMMPEEFEQFISLPENAERLYELINGEAVEKMPSNPDASEIAQLVAFFIRLYLREHQLVGHVTNGQGGYMVDGERYAPDVAYIAQEKRLARTGYNPMPPQLAVEVESPSTVATERRLRTKLYHYLAAGTLVWVIYPETEEVEIHQVGVAPQVLTIADTLTGDALPGFTLPVRDIFP